MTFLVCHCVNRKRIPSERLADARGALKKGGHCVIDVPDFCAACAADPVDIEPVLRQSDAVICGCHERALQALATRVLAGAVTPKTVDLSRDDIDASALGNLGVPSTTSTPEDVLDAAELPDTTDAWYPTIDRERCTDCGRCHDFCLFGVYSLEEGRRVRVAAPHSCKTNCPACARICPANAIIFPKSPDEAINGAVLSESELATARIRLKPEELAGGNIYAKLAARRSRANPLPPLFRQGLFTPADPDSASTPGAGQEGDQ